MPLRGEPGTQPVMMRPPRPPRRSHGCAFADNVCSRGKREGPSSRPHRRGFPAGAEARTEPLAPQLLRTPRASPDFARAACLSRSSIHLLPPPPPRFFIRLLPPRILHPAPAYLETAHAPCLPEFCTRPLTPGIRLICVPAQISHTAAVSPDSARTRLPSQNSCRPSCLPSFRSPAETRKDCRSARSTAPSWPCGGSDRVARQNDVGPNRVARQILSGCQPSSSAKHIVRSREGRGASCCAMVSPQ
jgi:hypothetical protein